MPILTCDIPRWPDRNQEQGLRMIFRCVHRGRLALLVIGFVLLATIGMARAQVGQRNFYSALITEGTDPSNDFTLSPGWVTINNQMQAAFSFSIEKEITDNTSILVGNAISDASRRRVETSSGVDNIELLAKWAFYMNAEHEFRTGFALDVYAPTGDVQAGAGPLARRTDDPGEKAPVTCRPGLFHYLRPLSADGRGVSAEMDRPPIGHRRVRRRLELSVRLSRRRRVCVHAQLFLKPIVLFNEFNYQQAPWSTTNPHRPIGGNPGGYMTPLSIGGRRAVRIDGNRRRHHPLNRPVSNRHLLRPDFPPRPAFLNASPTHSLKVAQTSVCDFCLFSSPLRNRGSARQRRVILTEEQRDRPKDLDRFSTACWRGPGTGSHPRSALSP